MEAIKKEMRLSIPDNFKEGDRIPEIVIYSEENFGGIEYRTNCNIDLVGKLFNSAVKSIIVVSGTWEIFKNKNFSVSLIKLTPGYYRTVPEIDPNNKGISSFRCIIPQSLK